MTEVMIGQVMMNGFGWAPKNFATCDGQLIPIVQNQALYAVIGNTYGGTPPSTFALPDLRGRVPVGTTGNLGQSGGAETVPLSIATMASHAHAFLATAEPAATATAAGNLYAAGRAAPFAYGPAMPPQAVLPAGNVQPQGQGAAHANIQPSLGIGFTIALFGIFPTPP